MKKNTLWVARTAVLLALLLVLQFITKPLGQFVTGSCVNLVLAVAVLCAGLWSGVTVALVSPFLAFLLQIAPMPILLVPGVALGNLTLILVLHFAARTLLEKTDGKTLALRYTAAVGAAAAKFAVLWLVMTNILIPLAALPEQKAAALTATFTWPQLITALIGGVLAVLVAPIVRRSMKNES